MRAIGLLVFVLVGCNTVVSPPPTANFNIAPVKPEFGVSFDIGRETKTWQSQLKQLLALPGLKWVNIKHEPTNNERVSAQFDTKDLLEALELCERAKVKSIVRLEVLKTIQEYRDAYYAACDHPSVAIIELGERPFNTSTRAALEVFPKLLANIVENRPNGLMVSFDGFSLVDETGDNDRAYNPMEIRELIDHYAVKGNIKVRSQFRHFGVHVLEDGDDTGWKRLTRMSQAFAKAGFWGVATVFPYDGADPQDITKIVAKTVNLGTTTVLLGDSHKWFTSDEKTTKKWLDWAKATFATFGQGQ